ncbi:DnaJ-class molecular chaperone CbpA [hydrothermal vent metagenome]|uniref:DnaJ-class molecular chaperone CbpA n=1 Tax=hydrothermal vent metagenome TaxID=652676 RepID=A0A3B0ZS32_9ZZZZ
MEFKDYYEIMGVARDATQDEIKRAYRKLARKYHPDVSKESGAEEKFKAVGEAYEVLKDPEKRAAYDQLGSQWQQGQDFNPPPDWDAGFEFSGGGFTGADAEDFSDFFESLFGGAPDGHAGHYRTQRGQAKMRGEDRHAKILIDLEDAVEGRNRQVTLRIPELTKDGHVVTRERTLNVRIPKGIHPGQHIRLTGQGGLGGGGGSAGDLYLEVEFKPHRWYRVEGADLYLDLPVAPWEAALGASVKVPTPQGTVDLKIPEGSSSGKKMRLKGRGMPSKVPGDLYVVLQIVLPPADSDDARQLYREMQEKLAFNPRKQLGV